MTGFRLLCLYSYAELHTNGLIFKEREIKVANVNTQKTKLRNARIQVASSCLI